MFTGTSFCTAGWCFDLKAAFLNQYQLDSVFRSEWNRTGSNHIYLAYRFSGLVDSMYRAARGLPSTGPPAADIQAAWDTIPAFVASNAGSWITTPPPTTTPPPYVPPPQPQPQPPPSYVPYPLPPTPAPSGGGFHLDSNLIWVGAGALLLIVLMR